MTDSTITTSHHLLFEMENKLGEAQDLAHAISLICDGMMWVKEDAAAVQRLSYRITDLLRDVEKARERAARLLQSKPRGRLSVVAEDRTETVRP